MAAISLVLFQAPLFYMRQFNTDIFNVAFGTSWLHFFNNWFHTILVLALSWFFSFTIIKGLYGIKWSLRMFKTALLLLSLISMVLFIMVFFSLNDLPFIIPTVWVFVIFGLSYIISIELFTYVDLREKLYFEKRGIE